MKSKGHNTASFTFKELEKNKEIKAHSNHVAAAGMPFAVTLTELIKEKVK